MNSRVRAWLGTLLLILTSFVSIPAATANGCGVSVGGPFDGGDGSSGSPFLVSTASQLASMETNACLTNGYHFKQTADIDLAGVTWTPLGTAFDFDGTYDGDFHTISNLTISSGDAVVNAGLFGTISGATIINLRVANADVTGSGESGVLAALVTNASTVTKIKIQNSSVETAAGRSAGAITGMTETGLSSISLVSVDADVTAGGNGGGLVGQVESGTATITNVYFSGSVAASGAYSGGIVGYGIAPVVSNAYSIGTITGGTAHRGGVIGDDGTSPDRGSVTDSFYLSSGVTPLDSAYGTAKNSAELSDIDTYPTWATTDDLGAVLDQTATEDWLVYPTINDGYPVLAWEIDAGFRNPRIFSANDFFTASSNQVVAATATTATYATKSADYLDWVLTDDAGTRAGAVWFKSRLDLSKDFEINAEVYLGDSDGGADGLAFVMQSSAATSLSTGGGLGFGSIVPALAVEFDTYPNGATTDHDHGTNDYWGIYNNPSVTGGSASTVQAVDPDNVVGTDKQFSLGNIEDDTWRAVRFTWVAETETYAASVDNNSDGDFLDAGEVLSKTGLALAGASSTFGDSPVYWGFTASTGGATNEQRVRFKQGAELLATSVANNAPAIEDESDEIFDVGGGSQTLDFTISDDQTTQAQWSVAATSSDTGKATVSAQITSATNARLTVVPAAVGSTTVTVTITDADGASASDVLTVTISSVPDAPTSLTATAGQLKADLSWTGSADPAGAAVTGYKIELNDGSGFITSTADTGSTATTATITSLLADTSYVFRVSAINALGTSSASTQSTSVVVFAPPAGPRPYEGPTDLAVAASAPSLGKGVAEGQNLVGIKAVFVGGVETSFELTDDGRLLFAIPDLTPGTYAVKFYIPANGLYLTQNIRIVESDPVTSPAFSSKVNAGSFKGYVAVYAKGYEGSRLSAKVGADWVIVPSVPAATNDLFRYVEFTGAGVDVAVRIYIDRVLVDTINLTTK